MNTFPKELRELIRGTHSDLRQEILSYLMKNQPSTYTSIKDDIKPSKGNFNYHLSTLIEAGLLIRQIKKGSKKDDYNTYYSISNLGKYFINNLFQTLQPELRLPKNTFERSIIDKPESQIENTLNPARTLIDNTFAEIQNVGDRDFAPYQKLNKKLEL
ncbi:MAG: transcriptional regulator [Thaumarchaeota archaeon]|nr:transcriptional regulator [Nitrososphaerota archaeon]